MSATSTRQWSRCFFFALPLVAMMSPASATTYDYTGNNFTAVIAPYTTSDAISGYITLSQPLGDNLPLTEESGFITAYSFTDGVQTLSSQANNSTVTEAFFTTDLSGAIVDWLLKINSDDFLNGIYTDNYDPDIQDLSFRTPLGCTFGCGQNLNDPGTWSSNLQPTPIPSSLPLFASSLAALGLLGWWVTKRKAARTYAACSSA